MSSSTSEKDTLRYYNDFPQDFFNSTVSADMSDARDRFIKHMKPGGKILDFGCGSGRDAKAFLDLGFDVDACDGSEELCRIASDYTGIKVRPMLFGELDACSEYDGIWACASILHLPKHELSDVFQRISKALKQGGILYVSFKYGDFEGMRSGRYFTDLTEETLAQLLKANVGENAALEPVSFWISCDVRPGRGDERWINMIAKKN